MCTVSMIVDYQTREWFPDTPTITIEDPAITNLKYRVSDLEKEIFELKRLLEAAKLYDKNTGQPDCEMKEKVEILRRIAEEVGVDLSDVFE